MYYLHLTCVSVSVGQRHDGWLKMVVKTVWLKQKEFSTKMAESKATAKQHNLGGGGDEMISLFKASTCKLKVLG